MDMEDTQYVEITRDAVVCTLNGAYETIQNKSKPSQKQTAINNQIPLSVISLAKQIKCSVTIATIALVISVISMLVVITVITVNMVLESRAQLSTTVDSIDRDPPTDPPIGSFLNPANSCSDIPQDKLSGEYWILNDQGSLMMVYCDMNQTSCSCNAVGGWMRVANLDMTDPNQNCPDRFRLVNRTEPPLRTCGVPKSISRGCVSTFYPTHGVEYSQVCGKIIGYQFGRSNGFGPNLNDPELSDIDRAYVNGLSLTHGLLPRQHIWTFAAARTEVPNTNDGCPCINSRFVGVVPDFVEQSYFCETGNRDPDPNFNGRFFAEDPLWDGQGCGGTSTCCQLNNSPWFCKQLPQPTTDNIELRICRNGGLAEDSPIELVEIYVQ